VERARAGFLENRGQWPPEARFCAQGGGACAWFVDEGWWLVLRGREAGARVAMRFEGARSVRPLAEDALRGQHHFLRGGDPAAFVLGALAFERLRWQELYAGVDVVARAPRAPGAGALFEYDLELAAGADLERVVVELAGHAGLSIDSSGRLVIETAAGTLVESPPRAWQMTPAGPEVLECRFRLLDGARFGFVAPGRDAARAAWIDPALIFSTYLSGNGDQIVEEIALGPLDDVFAAGMARSDSFPTTPGAFQPPWGGYEDAFVTRFAADGQLVWSTYLAGASVDLLRGLAVDAAGAATVCGDTSSTDFPTLPGSFDTTANGFFDAFCARLAPTGDALLFGTYLGGLGNDRAADLGLDASGAATVVGSTNGAGFPATAGSMDPTFNGGAYGGDAFCLRLDPSGQLAWSTFFGGPSDEGATAVAVEMNGEVTIGGLGSAPMTMSQGAFQKTFKPPGDAWVLRLEADGAQAVFGTWLGGSGLEEITRIALDGSGASAIAGRAESADFPTTPGALDTVFGGASEGFLLELDAQGSALGWGTFLGGAEDDEVTGLAVVPGGGWVAAVSTYSSGLPATPGCYDGDFNASLFGLFRDAYLVKLLPQAQAVDYGTYFGTEDDDMVRDVAVDSTGAAVLGGATYAGNFPTTANALQPAFNVQAQREGFVSRLAFLRHPIPYGTGTPPGSGGVATIDWSGFPDLATNDFRVRIDGAAPNTKAILFHGFAPQANPFYSGTMYVVPPLKRHRPVTTDAFGSRSDKVKIEPAWVGSTVYFQWWFEDPLLKKNAGLSNALEVTVYP
jgi:hypothetical protein